MELKGTSGYPKDEVIISDSRHYIKGVQAATTIVSKSNEVSWVTLDGSLDGESMLETIHSLDSGSGVFILNLNKKSKSPSQHLRMVLTQSGEHSIEII